MLNGIRESHLNRVIARRLNAHVRQVRDTTLGKEAPSRRFVMQGLPVAVGIDVVTVAEVAAALERFGDRYVRCVFTAQEAAYCRGAAGAAAAARFAARFAAKEATVLALHPHQRWVDWTAIEVRRCRSGRCALVLHRHAASLAVRRGFEHFELSISHDGDQAVAIVVALRGTPPATTKRTDAFK
jgi:holo-[acyl-carrier protein] synthase